MRGVEGLHRAVDDTRVVELQIVLGIDDGQVLGDLRPVGFGQGVQAGGDRRRRLHVLQIRDLPDHIGRQRVQFIGGVRLAHHEVGIHRLVHGFVDGFVH